MILQVGVLGSAMQKVEWHSGEKFLDRDHQGGQTFQNPLIKEYTLIHIRDPIII